MGSLLCIASQMATFKPTGRVSKSLPGSGRQRRQVAHHFISLCRCLVLAVAMRIVADVPDSLHRTHRGIGLPEGLFVFPRQVTLPRFPGIL